MTLTSRQLAERIVEAVRACPADDQAAEAVMDTLRAEHCWLCRLEEVAGATTFTTLPHETPPLPFE